MCQERKLKTVPNIIFKVDLEEYRDPSMTQNHQR
jgi:hypothetical protein